MSKSSNTDFDVICVGSGLAAACAAAVASENGLRSLIVEKTSALGGVTTYSGGQTWLPGSHLEAQLGIEDSIESGITYLARLAGGWESEPLTRSLIEAAPKALLHFEQAHGLAMEVQRGIPDYFYPRFEQSKAEGRYLVPQAFDVDSLGDWAGLLRRSPFGYSGAGLGQDGTPDERGNRFVVMGEALAGYALRAAKQAGAVAWTNSPVVSLLTQDGRVTGVVVRRDDHSTTVSAKYGVVLATGGYDRNSELVHRYEGVFDPHGSMSPPGIEGDHLLMGSEVGAAITQLPPQRNVMMFGFRAPFDADDGLPLHTMYWPAQPNEIVVNREGSRFANETFYPSVAAAVHDLDGNDHRYHNWPAWLVFDSKRADSFMPGPPAEYCLKAPDLRSLAQQAGIDPDGLSAGVERYNAECAAGRDTDFGRGEVPWVIQTLGAQPTSSSFNATLGPIDQPPYFAAQLSRVQLGVPAAGLEINEHAQAVDLRGRPIPNLYAAGNAAGRNDLGACFQSGLPNLRSLTYGYLAGLHIAKMSKDSPGGAFGRTQN